MLFIKKLKPMTRDSGTEAVNRGKIAGVNFIVTPYNGGHRNPMRIRMTEKESYTRGIR